MGFEQPVPPVKTKFVPTHETFNQCYEMGKALGEALAAKCAE
jgi:flavorubredoxin